ncbi:MAG: 2,5-diamino-6-(ribosylamino)-4(3H)-pyrimidinone 5'-phosphate reductase [Anaerolineales bacterium]|nr:2,5-diamino-6-(ribosylamino)-4(3H)-pyrimidinone 5'-phosphate reductase [Anaerolineales bacterium]
MDKQPKPWVILNAAMTADGKIDSAARRGAKISSANDWQRVDQLRAEVDAVMIGGSTLLAEDPRLTVKSPHLRQQRLEAGLAPNPAKVGIISKAKLPPNGRFMRDGGARVFIFTTAKTSPEQIAALQAAGAVVELSKGDRVDLSRAIQILGAAGITRILLEGGGTLNAAMFAQGLVDELRVYLAPIIFGGSNAPTLADGRGFTPDEAVRLKTKDTQTLPDGGILIHYLVEPKF